MSETDEYDISFDFVRFIKFLKKHNIATTAIAAVLSDRINEVTNKFFDHIILPIINVDRDKDGVKDIHGIENSKITLFGINFTVGKVLIAVVKFLLMTYIIFVISRVLKKYS